MTRLMFAAGALLSAGLIAVGVVWDLSSAPEPLLPEVVDSPPLQTQTQPTDALLNYSFRGYRSPPTPKHTVRIINADAGRFKGHFISNAPALGWLVSEGDRVNDLLVTMPRRDLPHVDAIIADPTGWTLSILAASPRDPEPGESFINLVIDVEGYRGRTSTPLLLIATAGVLLATALSGVIIMPRIMVDYPE